VEECSEPPREPDVPSKKGEEREGEGKFHSRRGAGDQNRSKGEAKWKNNDNLLLWKGVGEKKHTHLKKLQHYKWGLIWRGGSKTRHGWGTKPKAQRKKSKTPRGGTALFGIPPKGGG